VLLLGAFFNRARFRGPYTLRFLLIVYGGLRPVALDLVAFGFEVFL